MCGIAGFIDHRDNSMDARTRVAIGERMAASLRYRGPDDGGVWAEDAGMTLAHRRLAVLDLSPEGHQPMISPSGRYVISYNGEVYNFAELRRELESVGFRFRGHSDTEVMLAAVEAWGIEAAVRRFIGMFAMALWDRKERKLSLIRDRLGIKPLYYGWSGDVFLFASELKALRFHPDFREDIDRDALCLYLQHSYIPAPHTIYKGISKLMPGHILTVPWGARNASELQHLAYWTIRQAAEIGMQNRFVSDGEALEALEFTLGQAVASRMIADVPLGAFLSGGVDSSAIVALMQANSSRPIRTFSIGFYEQGYNEADHARSVAEHLGTDHTELYVTPQEAQSVIPGLPAMFDEPFADSSQIPTYLVSRLARNHVTVSLSGDGGDELFAGYDRYFRMLAIWERMQRIPMPLRKTAGWSFEHSPAALADAASMVGRLFPGTYSSMLTGDRLKKLGGMLLSASPSRLYRQILTHWPDAEKVVKGAREPEYFFSADSNWRISDNHVENMCFADMSSYLPDDILTKVDRASMAVSLEARVPLIDHRVVELSWRIPVNMKIRNGTGKWLLRQLLYKHVPKALMDRPKMGFGVPIDQWLRGPLRDWAEALLAPERLQREGYFNPAPIRKKWKEHLSGQRRWHYYLWDILMFQAWQEQRMSVPVMPSKTRAG